MLAFRPLCEVIGAEVSGVDLAEPLSAADFERIRAIWLDRTILVFRDQSMTPAQQIAFSRRRKENSAARRHDAYCKRSPHQRVLPADCPAYRVNRHDLRHSWFTAASRSAA